MKKTGFERLTADELLAFVDHNLPLYKKLVDANALSAAARIGQMIVDANAELARKAVA